MYFFFDLFDLKNYKKLILFVDKKCSYVSIECTAIFVAFSLSGLELSTVTLIESFRDIIGKFEAT